MFYKYENVLYMNPVVSKNGKYLAYKKEFTTPCVILVQKGKVLFRFITPRPNLVEVSSCGKVVVNDCEQGQEGNVVTVLNKNGSVITEMVFTANVLSLAICDKGKYVFVETAKSKTDHSFQFFVVDINKKAIISKFDSPFCGLGGKPEIDHRKQTVTFNLLQEKSKINFKGNIVL